MRTVSTTNARKSLSTIVDSVKTTGKPIAIGRRNKPEVLVIPAPTYNHELSDTTNLAMLGGSFDFLWEEPDIYSNADVVKRYA